MANLPDPSQANLLAARRRLRALLLDPRLSWGDRLVLADLPLLLLDRDRHLGRLPFGVSPGKHPVSYRLAHVSQ